MICGETRSALVGSRSRSRPAQFAALLQEFYQGLLEQGVPENMAKLVRRLEQNHSASVADDRRLALVVEGDENGRALAAALLEESDLTVIECASAEAALAVLQQRADDVAFVLADHRLSGRRDGVELAKAVVALWPGVRIVVTTDGSGNRPAGLPEEVAVLPKPWRGLDVLMEAERALSS